MRDDPFLGEMTEELIAEYAETFRLFDKDGDGTIGTEELKVVMSSLGQNPSDEELQDLIRRVDTNDNNKIEFSEFLDLMTMRFETEQADKEIRVMFDIFDKDKDGFISLMELQHVMQVLGAKMTQEELEEMILQATARGHRPGKLEPGVNFDQFKMMVSRT